jgi:hypothetical protein
MRELFFDFSSFYFSKSSKFKCEFGIWPAPLKFSIKFGVIRIGCSCDFWMNRIAVLNPDDEQLQRNIQEYQKCLNEANNP